MVEEKELNCFLNKKDYLKIMALGEKEQMERLLKYALIKFKETKQRESVIEVSGEYVTATNMDIEEEIKQAKIEQKKEESIEPLSILIANLNNKYLGQKVKMKVMVSKTGFIAKEAYAKEVFCSKCAENEEIGYCESEYCPHCTKKRILVKEFSRDFKEIEVEEILAVLDRQPERKKVKIIGKLLNTKKVEFLSPGTIIELVATLCEEKVKNKLDRAIFDYYLLADEITISDLDEEEEILTNEDIEKIKEIAKDKPIEKLRDSLAPNIYDYDKIKTSLLLQMVRGPENMQNTRPMIHILLCGPASCAKSKLAEACHSKTPRSIYGSGENMSKAGIISSMEKDELSGRWGVRAGMLCRASKSLAIIDECFPKDTEILTEQGFIKFQDLKDGIKVAEYYENGNIDFVLPSRIINNPYNGNLIKIKSYFGTHISTPNHKRVILDYKNNLKKIQVMDSLSTSNKIILNGEYNGKGVNLSKEELRWMVAFNADGCIKNKNYGYICVKKKRKKDRLIQICKDAKIKYTLKHIKNNSEEYYSFYFGDIIQKYYSKIGDKYVKKFPVEWFINLSLTQRKVIIEELKFWDGCKCSKNSWQFFTSKEDEAKLIYELGVTSGYYVHSYRRKKKGYVDNISLTFSNKKYKTQRKMLLDKIPYNDNVYCVTVPTGMIIIKQDGHTQITGNCDKLSNEDKNGLHTPMEMGKIFVDKAGLHAEMMADVSILGCCNPKNGKFDLSHMDSIQSQINLSEPLMSRFDLIYIIHDKVDLERDSKILKGMINTKKQVGPIGERMFKKYIKYATKLEPVIDEEVSETFVKIVTDLRQAYLKMENKDNKQAMTFRQGSALIRLAVASAKLRLSQKVELIDLKLAEDLMLDALESAGFAKDFNSFESAALYGGTTKKKMNLIEKIKNLIQVNISQGLITEDELKKSIVSDEISEKDFLKVIIGLRQECTLVGTYNNLKWVN
jgi:DNA replicative helicase MCM subunit Mcm2 (Cdc46/Mcm family)